MSDATGVHPDGIWLGLPHTCSAIECVCPEPARMEAQVLRAKARNALQNGELPNRKPDRTWGGRGVGVACAVCDLPVTKDQAEFELEFARDGDNPDLDKFHVHVRCFAAWEFERRENGP